MKKSVVYVLIVSLIISLNIIPNPVYGEEAANQSSISLDNVPQQEKLSGEIITITSITEKFNVSRDWVINEMDMGYSLNQIYQGLLHQSEQSLEYEQYMTQNFPNIQRSAGSVTSDVYGMKSQELTVTDTVYNTPSITDATYGLLANRMNYSTKPYDDIALKRINVKTDQAPYQVSGGEEQISTVDGSLSLRVTDLVLPGPNGLDFPLTRVYDSSRSKDQMTVEEQMGWYLKNTTKTPQEDELFPLGKGWIWDISHIKFEGSEKYLYVAGMGSYQIFEDYNPQYPQYSRTMILGYPWGDLFFAEDEGTVKVGEKLSAYRVDNLKGTTQYFDHAGKLIQIIDAYGNKIMFLYGYDNNYNEVLKWIVSTNKDHIKTNNLYISYADTEITISMADRVVKYKKSKKKSKYFDQREYTLLTEVIDAQGRSTKYDYDDIEFEFNLVEAYKDYTSVSDKYTYWGFNICMPLKLVEHPTKALTKYAYGSSLRKVGRYGVERVYRFASRDDSYSTEYSTVTTNKQSLRFQSDPGDTFGQDSTFTTVLGTDLTETTFTYKKDYIDTITPDVYYNTRTEVKDSKGAQKFVTNYSYDEARQRPVPIRIEERAENGTGASPWKVLQRTFNDWGQVLTETNPLQVTQTNTYDLTGINSFNIAVLRSTSVPVNVGQALNTVYEHNRQGSLTQTLSSSGNGGPLLQSNYEYDDAGNPIKIKLKDNQRDTIINQEFSPEYKSMFMNKQQVNVTDIDGQVSTIVSQAAYIPETGEVTKFTNGRSYSTTYQYDKIGRITAEINPDGSQTTINYDDNQNITTITDPTGVVIKNFYDPLGRKTREVTGRGTTEYYYDVNSRVKQVDYPSKGFVYYEYDAFNRLTKDNFIYGNISTVYDDINNTKTTTDFEKNSIIESYDLLGRIIQKDEIKASGKVTLERYTYDYAGNVKTLTDANGKVTKYDYDALGRIISVTDAENKTTSYTYSLAGNLIQVKYPDGNVVKKQHDEIGRLIEQQDPSGQRTKIYYDANSNVVKRVDRKGQTQSYEYNNRDFLISDRTNNENIQYTYDNSGKRLTMLDQTGTSKYAYHPTGELSTLTYPDQTSIAYDYESRGLQTKQTLTGNNYTLTSEIEYNYMLPRPETLSMKDSNGQSLAKYSYEYKRNNQLNKVTSSNGQTQTVTYDGTNLTNLQQLQGATPLNTYQYQYDNNRNIIGKTENGTYLSFTYDPLNRIKSSSQLNEMYSYDNRDNRMTLVSDRVPDIKGMNYEYDDRNRLTKITTEDGKVVSYRYNGDGLMVERTENGKITLYYYDASGRVVGEGTVGSNGQVTMNYGYTNSLSGQVLARQDASTGQLQYYSLNGHGDVVELRDAAGNVLNKYTYDIWGNPLSESEQVPNIFRYSGEYWDSTTGLQYLRARWYDPSVGRFINEDTYEGKLNDPLSLNLYTYVANNPLRFFDPSGHIPTPIEAAQMASNIYEVTDDNIGITLPGGWRLQKIYKNTESLKMGVYYRIPNNGLIEYSLVNKGTDIEWDDIVNDVQQPLGYSTDMKDSVRISTEFVDNHKYFEVTFVGHSKGGAEAIGNAVATNRNAITFNPAVPKLNKYGLDASSYTGYMRNFVVTGDALNGTLGEPSVGKMVYLPTQHKTRWWYVPAYNINQHIKNHKMAAVKAAIREGGYD